MARPGFGGGRAVGGPSLDWRAVKTPASIHASTSASRIRYAPCSPSRLARSRPRWIARRTVFALIWQRSATSAGVRRRSVIGWGHLSGRAPSPEAAGERPLGLACPGGLASGALLAELVPEAPLVGPRAHASGARRAASASVACRALRRGGCRAGRYHGGRFPRVAGGRHACATASARPGITLPRDRRQLVGRARRAPAVARQRLRTRALEAVDERRPRIALAPGGWRVLLLRSGSVGASRRGGCLATAAERDVGCLARELIGREDERLAAGHALVRRWAVIA